MTEIDNVLTIIYIFIRISPLFKCCKNISYLLDLTVSKIIFFIKGNKDKFEPGAIFLLYCVILLTAFWGVQSLLGFPPNMK